MAELGGEELCTIVHALVRDAEAYRDDRAEDRLKAMAFYDGDPKDMQKYVPVEEGRSRVVSRDVRAAVKKILPSIYRTILGNDQIVEYQPVGEGDEETAEQATDYINFVALPECDGRTAIQDAIHDAVLLRNGIIKWWFEEITDVKVSLHTGLDETALALLVNDENVEVLEHTERAETVEVQSPEGETVPIEMPVHDVRIRCRHKMAQPALAAVPLENWLIHPDAIKLEDSPILGEYCKLRRTDLVRMGYDRDVVWSLPSARGEDDVEEDARRRDSEEGSDSPQRALDEIDYYDLLVRIDQDGDGIAELRRMIFAGGIKPQYLLENVEWDEIHYADIVAERRPHQWEGTSVADDAIEVQTVKTVLLRQTLDNLYWQNNLQPTVQLDAIENPDDVINPQFGKPIRIKAGRDVREAIQYNIVPFVADKSFAMLEYLDQELTDRTGISDASSGMAPDALQNMTAKASAMIEQAGIGQVEMMVRCIAESLKPVFRGLLKLVIQHQDKPRTVRLRDEWVTFDPRTWNADMDAVVNVGLGAGTRERDMMAMMQVIALQERILASMGPAVGMQFVTPTNLYNAISKLTEAAGLKTVGLYFSEPDEQAIQQAMVNQPDPEEIKAQAAMQLEQVRGQTKMQVEAFKTQAKREEFAAKMQAEASKEREQLAADLQTSQAELQVQAEAKRQELVAQTLLNEQDNAAELQRQALDQQIEREKMALDYRMHREDLMSKERVAAHKAQTDMARAEQQVRSKQQPK